MRIAVWHNLPSGGGKRALHDQIRGLTARGHHVESWSPDSADAAYLPLDTILEEHIQPLQLPQRTDWDRRLHRPVRVASRLAAMAAHCRLCAEEMATRAFDILLVHPCTFFRTSPIAQFIRIPKILYLQEPYRWLYEAMPRLPWLAPEPSALPLLSLARVRELALDLRTMSNARIQGREELRNARAFDRILVNSLFSRESVLRAYGLDSEVCYLGTDLDRFIDRRVQRENLVVGLGAFTPEKNLRLAIEAVGLLDRPRPALAWIGNVAEPGMIEEMTTLAEARGVVFTPHLSITDDAIVALLNRASVMVYVPRLEPFGLAPIEAAACGLPVVGVAEGGVRETVIDGVTGFLVANTSRAVADALARLLADPTLGRRMGAAGRANAEQRWSFAAGTDHIEQALFRQLTRVKDAARA